MYCIFCGQDLPDNARFCRKCGQKLGDDSSIEQNLTVDSDNSQVGKTCPFCQFPVKPAERYVVCPSCKVPHHQECWKENGNKCTTFGCREQVIPNITLNDRQAAARPYPRSEQSTQWPQVQQSAEFDLTLWITKVATIVGIIIGIVGIIK